MEDHRRRKRTRRRRRELEREASRRAHSGSGCGGACLPPLPGTAEEREDGPGGVGPGHPYGALPYGNIVGDPAGDVVRRAGLGPGLRALNDEQLLAVLSYVDGPSLAGGAAGTSRFLYAACHHEELWRDLCLRRWGGGDEGGLRVPSPDEGRDASRDGEERPSGGCWRDVYAFNHLRSSAGRPEARPPFRRHVPIRVRGVYSDALYRSFLCRSFAMHPSWLAAQTVPAVPIGEMTTGRFLADFERANRPVLLRGASAGWPAVQRWTPSYLRGVAGGREFRATSGAAPLPASFEIGDYLNYCESAAEESPLYLFDRTFAAKCPRLLEDFDGALRESCPWWSRGDEESAHDLFGLLGETRRPDYQWLIVGPKRSGSCFHIDPNCTHAWNAPIVGRKRWIFYPPGVTPPGVHPSPSGDDVCMPISIGEWFLTFWNEHVRRRSDPDPGRRPLECTARPGDVLFVPHGWWHMVVNIGDEDDGGDGGGISVALTRNYVSGSNLPDVLRFLDTRVGQISGCRDRADAVKPEALGEEFRRALTTRGGGDEEEEEKKSDDAPSSEGRSRWSSLLREAEAASRKGWSCAAWSDPPPSEEAVGCRGGGSSVLSKAKGPCASNAGGIAGGGFSFSFL